MLPIIPPTSLRSGIFLCSLGLLIFSLGATGCLPPPEGEGADRCPPGVEYDEQRQRCVSGNGYEDTGVSDGDTGDGDADTGTGDGGTGDADTGTGDGAQDADVSNGDGDGGTGDEDVPIPGDCGDTLAERFTTVPVPDTSYAGRVHASHGPNDGAFIAWKNGSQIEVTRARADGSVATRHTFDGDEIYGFAANDDSYALLIFKQSDILSIVIADHDGTVVEDKILIGDVDHNVEGSEWFGHLIRDGRLTEGDGRWAAYYTVQRLWPDGIAHYGDQLTILEADGTSAFGGWDWGCSHSMEVRISHNGQQFGPLCSSDCFPTKGVHYNHRGGELWPDEEGSDCAGQYGTSLGASVPTDDGFWLTFTATDDRDSHDVAISRVTGNSPGDTLWLTEDEVDAGNLNSGLYDSDLLVAWTTGATWSSEGTTHFTLVSDPDGGVVSGPQEIPGARLVNSSDFFLYSNGDVGWAQSSADNEVELARLTICP